MVQIVYCPLPSDNDETEVAGVVFKAYEPTDVDNSRVVLINRLLTNPWFGQPGDAVEARKAEWKKVRDAQAMAAQHRAFADKVEAEAAKSPPEKAAEIPTKTSASPPLGSRPAASPELH